MRKFSILLALVFVLASCGKAVEEVNQAASPIKEATSVAVIDENVVTEAKDAMLKEADVMVKDETVMVKDEEAMVKSGGSFQDYSEEAVNAVEGTKVLFFHASWCGTCVASEKSFKANPIAEGLHIFKLDFDTQLDLRQKYGVTTKHTFVHIDDNMEKIELVVGLNTAEDIKNAFMSDDKVMKDEEVMVKDETAMEKEEVMEEKEVIIKEEAVVAAPIVAAGSFQDYSEEAVKASTGNSVLFFHASWCSSCKAAEKSINEAAIPEGLNVFKIDYDSNVALRQKYGVTTKHTFVLVDENMEKVKLMVGASNSEDIVNGLLK